MILKQKRIISRNRPEAELVDTVSGIGAKIPQDYYRPAIMVQAPRAPGVLVNLVDHTKDNAPAEAIYRISVYLPGKNGEINSLCSGFDFNVDLNEIYVGKRGLLLDHNALERAREFLKKKSYTSS